MAKTRTPSKATRPKFRSTPLDRTDKAKAPKKPTQLDRIENALKQHSNDFTTIIGWLGDIEAKLASPTVAVEGLRDGDYTDASKEVADNLTAMGFAWHDKDRTVWGTIRWMMSDCKMVNGSSIPPSTHCPPAVFLARAAVTAKALGLEPVDEAKLKAEAQAAEDAKLVFGARVEVRGSGDKWLYLSHDSKNWYRLARSTGSELFERKDFTLLP